MILNLHEWISGNDYPVWDSWREEIAECFELFVLFVQCPNGHTLCSSCKTRVDNRCPTCRQELGDIRCLALEKIAESLKLACKFSTFGCQEILPYYSKLKHESACYYRPYTCPYAGSDCPIDGNIPFLVSHLRDDHKVDMHSGCTFNHRYVKANPCEVENATWMLTVRIHSTWSNSRGWQYSRLFFTYNELLFMLLFHLWLRSSTALASISVFILKPFSWVWHQFTWHFCDSWGTKPTLETSVTASRLVEMVGSWYGKATLEAFGTTTRKLGTAMTVSLYNETWRCSFREEKGKSWSCGSRDGFGKNKINSKLVRDSTLYVFDCNA